MNELNILVNRMKWLNIELTLVCNYPLIYLMAVNGNKVKEIYESNHFFTIAYATIKKGDKIKFTNINKMFNVIRNNL